MTKPSYRYARPFIYRRYLYTVVESRKKNTCQRIRGGTRALDLGRHVTPYVAYLAGDKKLSRVVLINNCSTFAR